jgi:hypothetical protein
MPGHRARVPGAAMCQPWDFLKAKVAAESKNETAVPETSPAAPASRRLTSPLPGRERTACLHFIRPRNEPEAHPPIDWG